MWDLSWVAKTSATNSCYVCVNGPCNKGEKNVTHQDRPDLRVQFSKARASRRSRFINDWPDEVMEGVGTGLEWGGSGSRHCFSEAGRSGEASGTLWCSSFVQGVNRGRK